MCVYDCVCVPCAAMKRSALGGLSAYPDHTPGNPTDSSNIAEYGEMALRLATGHPSVLRVSERQGASYADPARYVPEYGQHATIGQGPSVNFDNRKVTVFSHADFGDFGQPGGSSHGQAQTHEQQGGADTWNSGASSTGTGGSVVTSDSRVTYATFPSIGAKPHEAKHRHDLASTPPISLHPTITTTGAPAIPSRLPIDTAQNGTRTMVVPGADVGESTVDGDDDGYAHPISPPPTRMGSGPVFIAFAAAKQWACTLLVAPRAPVPAEFS